MKKSRLEVPSQWKERKIILRKLGIAFAISGLISINALAGINTSSSESNVISEQQQKQISGKVVDNTNQPIPGASILVKGTTIGCVTDVDGNFKLNLPDNAETLQFSFVGMKSQEVAVSGKTTVNIVMEVDAIGLEEVVAVGYGNQQKKDITGAVSSVKSEDFNKGVISSPEQLLQGKISGVNITSSSGAPGAGQRIIIRGQGSLRQGTGPLFVIDGFLVGLAGTGSESSPLNFINPEDIESMDVLKDASATAIYGARGANGVILITTKRGTTGISKVTVSSSVGVSQMARKLPVFSADEFRKKVVEVGGRLEDKGGNTDWQDVLTRTAITNDHNLVLKGGSQKTNYYASLGFLDQQGIIIETGLKRYSGRVNITQKLLDDRLKIDFNLNTTVESGENCNASTMVSQMIGLNPTYPAYDAKGEPTVFNDILNPLIDAKLYRSFSENRRLIANISPSFEIVKGLIYKLNFGYQNTSGDYDYQAMPSTIPFERGRLEQSFSNGRNTMIENYLTYTRDFGDHNFSVLAGHSYQETFGRWRGWSIDLFSPTGVEPHYNPGLGSELDLVDNKPGGWASINELQSFFGRANYSFKGKILLTATVRADGSSKFGDNKKYGVFPSFAAGWRISDEPFMKSSPFTNLKLRAGWGQTGNQEIPNKITQALFTTSVGSSSSYPLAPTGSYPAGTTYVRLANPDIQWEVSTQSNVGLDFALLKGKFSGTIDYFHKVSNNILLEVVPADPIQPATTYWTNVKDMTITNNGVELALDYQHKNKGGFSYGFGANITFIDNVVEKSPFTILTTGGASGAGLSSATVNGYVNGYPIGAFYMKEFDGIGSNGQTKFVDWNNDTKDSDADRHVVGSALPDKMFNFNANMSYKRFDLVMNFNGVSGNKIYDNTATANFYKARLAKSLNTTAAAVEYPEESSINPASVSTRYLKDGAFFRLNNATLAYNLNTKNIGIAKWIEELRLSVTGQNLFIITKYDGFDPEVNQDSSQGGIQSFGIDKNSYPKARSFVFGLNVTF
ncbi:MAG: TonB-dependent receptor [Prolixibacteraceae bacterium]|nr:TonB-dependent receptor [Prolixibacteraceae bacterium]